VIIRRVAAPVLLCTAGLLAACWSTTDPVTTAQVGGRTVVYGRVVDGSGAALTAMRVFVRHHTAVCSAAPNESATMLTDSNGRYRLELAALTTIGCVSVKVQPTAAGGFSPDSVTGLRPTFRQAAPLDSIAVNLTLRGGIQ
jgi:hypothetical protein